MLSSESCDALRAHLRASPGTQVSVDLERCEVSVENGATHSFEVHPTVRRNLLQGLDDVGVTQQLTGAIEAFEVDHKRALPWVFAD